MHYRVWIELRKLRTQPLLLVPGWTGFFVKVRDNIVVIQSTIGYLDTHWTRPPPTSRPHTKYSALDVKSRRGLS